MIISNRNLANRKISVSPFENDPDEFITVDLHVGDCYQEPGDANQYNLRGSYLLRPGRCILVSTKEIVAMPPDVFGQLCSKGSLAAEGLIIASTKVDPMYEGSLNISLFN